jgi:hypothetical protein
MAVFNGLQSEHFETYAPEKWSSMVHNLARMKTKDVVVSLADAIGGRPGQTFDGLVRGASDEIPNITNQKKVDSQWVYWYRNKESREALSSLLGKTVLDQASIFTTAAHEKHIILTVVLRSDKLIAGLRIAKSAEVDRNNLVAKLSKRDHADAFLELLADAPAELVVGPESELVSCRELSSPESLETMLETLREGQEAFFLGLTLDAAAAIDAGDSLLDTLASVIDAAARVYRMVSWSRENDFIGATHEIKREKQEKLKRAANFKPGDKVRITKGLLSGKIGIVESVDAKAVAKISIGTMSLKVSGQDLVPL